MSYKFAAFFFCMSILFISCQEDIVFKLNSPQKISISQKLTFSVNETNGTSFDSIHFLLDGKKVSSQNNDAIDIQNKTLGVHVLSAILFTNGTTKKLNNSVYFLAEKSPVIFGYEVINVFPHDPNAFTQGLEFYNGYLYESTGQNGGSSIRKTDINTGEVLKIKNLDAAYFGEGMTIFNEKIYQLTWRAKKGFIYDLHTFEQLRSFDYGKSKEGWGLSHNDIELIKSDGTERIWFLNPDTLKETRYIEAYTNKRKAERLNEIEYIEGKIYANIWQKNTIIIINAQNGAIEGVVDLNGLSKKIDRNDPTGDFVLNGIAYDKETKRLFVTGKNWDKTFEIKLIKK